MIDQDPPRDYSPAWRQEVSADAANKLRDLAKRNADRPAVASALHGAADHIELLAKLLAET